MSKITLGIIGGGQLGSMLAVAAKKLKIKTLVFSDNLEAPAENYSPIAFIDDDKNKIIELFRRSVN